MCTIFHSVFYSCFFTNKYSLHRKGRRPEMQELHLLWLVPSAHNVCVGKSCTKWLLQIKQCCLFVVVVVVVWMFLVFLLPEISMRMLQENSSVCVRGWGGGGGLLPVCSLMTSVLISMTKGKQEGTSAVHID